MTASVEPDGQPESPSVYDFLYIDAKRVGAFLAQFDLPGVPQSVKQAVAVEDTSGSENRLEGSAGIKGFVKLGGGSKDATSIVVKDATEQVFDPTWVNAISLLTHLDQRGLLSRGIAGARVGQFSVASGALGIIDYSTLKLVWEMPLLRQMVIEGVAASTTVAADFFVKKVTSLKQQELEKKKGVERQAEAIIDIAARMPHTLQARLVCEDYNKVFATLNEDGLVGTSSDLALKHGTLIPGQWNILGVVDALPDEPGFDAQLEAARVGVLTGDFALIIGALMPFLRNFGRPPEAHGMTPLLIFREVSAAG